MNYWRLPWLQWLRSPSGVKSRAKFDAVAAQVRDSTGTECPIHRAQVREGEQSHCGYVPGTLPLAFVSKNLGRVCILRCPTSHLHIPTLVYTIQSQMDGSHGSFVFSGTSSLLGAFGAAI